MKALAIAFVTCLCLSSAVAQDKPASQPATQPAPAPAQTFQASEADAIKGAVDKTATVHGTVSRTAWSPRGSVLFINFKDVDRDGFTAIVRKDNKDAVKDFGDDAADLVGKTVDITGKIILYRDKPEIEISKAEQIKIAAEAPASQPAGAAEPPPKQ